MIHMDIDMHSSPPRRQRCMPPKRARSPEPSSPQDRPSKRLSVNATHTNPYPPISVRRRLGDHSSGSSRHSSEDWVQQTRGLTIDSPILSGSFFPLEQEDACQMQKDEDMMDEGPEFDLRESLPRPEKFQLGYSQTPGFPSSFPSSEQHLDLDVPQGQNQPSIPSIKVDISGHSPFQEAQHLVTTGQHHPGSTPLGPNAVMGPSINIVPPTPMERQISEDYYHSTYSASNSSAISPISAVPPSRLMTSRKQPRFMMGPRANCEKCRLGVKGHFVHLD